MKNIFGHVLVILSLIYSTTFGQQYQFEWLNPLPQGNDLQSVGFFDSNNGIAIGNTGTLLKTTDSGNNWSYIFLAAPKNLNGLQIFDQFTAYIAGDNGLILKTTNSGSSWINLITNTTTNLTSVYFINSNIGYVTGYFGLVLKTTDGGLTWNSQSYYYNNKDVLFYDALNGFIIGDAGTFIRTSDGGTNWVGISLSTTEPLNDIKFLNQSVGYVVGGYYSNGIISKTSDGGNTWVNIVSNDPLGFKGIFFKDSNTGFVVGYNGTLKKTTNAGNTWNNAAINTKLDLISGYFINSNTGFITGAGGKVFKTTDGGNNWFSYTQGNENFLCTAAFWNQNVGIVAGQNGTILKTTNGGLSWIDKTLNLVSNPTIYDVEILNNNSAVATGWFGFIHITTDAGETWNSYSNVTSNDLNRLCFVNFDTGYAAGNFGTILKTTNGGYNWNPLTSGTNQFLNGLDFTNLSTGYICGSNGIILKTTNSGNNWFPLTSGTTAYLRDLEFVDSAKGFAVGDFSTILRTNNGGASWDSIYGVQYGPTFANIEIISPQVICVAGDSGKVLLTTDGGSNWNYLNSNTSNYLYGITYADTSLYIVGEKGSIIRMHNTIIPVELTSFNYLINNNIVILNWSTATELNNRGFEVQRSTDKETWQTIGFKVGKGTISEKQEYSFSDNIFEISVYKIYYRLKQIDFDGTFKYSKVIEIDISSPNFYSLNQNYPNPFNPSTKISWQSPVSGHQILKVYDLLGNEVSTLVDEYREAGRYEVTFDASRLSSGIYLYKLQAVNFIETKKMILIK